MLIYCSALYACCGHFFSSVHFQTSILSIFNLGWAEELLEINGLKITNRKLLQERKCICGIRSVQLIVGVISLAVPYITNNKRARRKKNLDIHPVCLIAFFQKTYMIFKIILKNPIIIVQQCFSRNSKVWIKSECWQMNILIKYVFRELKHDAKSIVGS